MTDLAGALVAVANGEHYIDPALAAELMTLPRPEAPPRLTSREQEVLTLIATGNTNEKAAAELGIRPRPSSHTSRTRCTSWRPKPAPGRCDRPSPLADPLPGEEPGGSGFSGRTALTRRAPSPA